MDYTNRPKTNQQPDKSNFDFLKQLYGEIGATQQPVAGAPSSQQDPSVGWSSNPPPQQETNQENNEEEENVHVVNLLTGTLYLYRGLHRRAEFVRKV